MSENSLEFIERMEAIVATHHPGTLVTLNTETYDRLRGGTDYEVDYEQWQRSPDEGGHLTTTHSSQENLMVYEETIGDIVRQELNEERFNRKHIDAKIRTSIEANPVMQEKLKDGVAMVRAYMAPATPYYESKATVGERLRGPLGLWDVNETFIDNNMQLVLDRLKEYYA